MLYIIIIITSPHLHDSENDRIITLVPSMYSFIFMNVARLINQSYYYHLVITIPTRVDKNINVFING